MIIRAKETYRGFLQDFYSDISELDKTFCHYANTDHHHDFRFLYHAGVDKASHVK